MIKKHDFEFRGHIINFRFPEAFKVTVPITTGSHAPVTTILPSSFVRLSTDMPGRSICGWYLSGKEDQLGLYLLSVWIKKN